MNASIDHVVTLTNDLDKAAAGARRLGFYCTPHSRHDTFSSANQTVVFEHEYWELVTILEPTPANAHLRRHASLRRGVHGLCASTDDLDDSAARSRAAGLAMGEPVSFGRKVVLDGVEHELGFRICNALSEPDGLMLFYCQHRTKHLVWRRQWRDHPNGALALSALTLISQHPRETAVELARLFGRRHVETAPGCHQMDTQRQTVVVECPDRALALAHLLGRQPLGTAVLGVRCRVPAAALSCAARAGARVLQTDDARYFACAPELENLVVEFIASV